MSAKRILIVGGGIGGLTAAIAFSRKNVRVDLVEIRERFTVYHVGIIIQANTLRAMKAIDMADKIVAAGFPYNGVKVCDADGNVQAHVQGPRLAGEAYPSDLGISRPALHRVLIDGAQSCGVDIRLGMTFDKIDDRGDRVDVRFTDGQTRSYDLVIGADGLNSNVRAHLFGPGFKAEFTGQGVWRYNVPRPAGVDYGALYVGKRYKAGFVPLSNDTMYILLNTSEPGNPMLPADQLARLMRERLADFGGLVGEARDKHVTDSSLVVYRPLEAIMMPRPWHKGRVTIMGDAAHATTPHLGQGAAQAVEDAIVLAEEVAADQDVEAALQRFEERRFERCKFINESSLLIGKWELTQSPDADHAGLRRQMLDVVAKPI